MLDPTPLLTRRLEDGAGILSELRTRASDRDRLLEVFPSLPRRLGRGPLGGGLAVTSCGTADLDAWRRCDAGAFLLLASFGGDDGILLDIYAHGDLDERTMLLRALALRPVTGATASLLGEVQRTNMVLHVEAAVCDSDLLSRSVGIFGFSIADWNRLVLKLAFLDIPLARAFDSERHANEDLTRMLQDLATEREAAGRPVWRDTYRLSGLAPTSGSIARLIGGIEHGDDGIRLSAAEGLLRIARPDLAAYARERIEREKNPAVLETLRRVTEAT